MTMNENKRIRVGVIGLGAVSNNHIRPLLSLENVELCALCDINEEKLQKKKLDFSLDVSLYTDYKEMIENEKLDTVHILTPHYLHAPMTVYALEHGLDVFLEKPMGISLSDIDAIRTAEKQSGRRVCVCFQNRFSDTTVNAKKIIEADGGVLSAYATVIWNRDASYYAQDLSWRGKWATEGGGVMINQAIHTLDLLCQFLGTPESVKASCQNHHLEGIIEVEDMCEGLIRFQNGRQALFYTTTAFDGGNVTSLYLTTKNHTIFIQNEHLYLDGEKYEMVETESEYYGKECYGKGHQALISLFYQAIRGGYEMPVDTESAQYALRLLLAAYQSNGTETVV
ncbi:MAG: Gfo/Idh/MocA family oxidoreductase [Clostridia bacterium]|nr:Gfo/Idh/MocA family oxidoreductase [Clostridia bacterium]